LVGARRQLCQRAVGATLGVGAASACAYAASPAHALPGPPRINKEVHTVSLSVSGALADKFSEWLPAYTAKLLELPGLLGAKILTPLKPVVQKPAVVFVLGGPGAGKGTQSEYIVNKYGYVHLSAGDLLRAERKSGSAQGQLIDDYIKDGKIVPVEITIKLLMAAIEANGGKRFLVDGFPRNTNNLAGWQKVAGEELNVCGVLFYDCPEEVMEARLLERGKTSGRSDDNLESIRKRFRTYVNETQPIIAYYDYAGLVHKIDGTRPVDDVWADSQKAVDTMEAALAAERVEFTVHLHATEVAPTLPQKLAADMEQQWGQGAVAVEMRGLVVRESLKAYGLDALRSFD